jgi:adenylate kinase
MRLILFGPPGVGKGTQSALLHQRLGLIAISSGDIFRREIESETGLGKLALRYIEAGQLVPDQVTIDMMAKRLDQADIRSAGFVLDGFPRTVSQAKALDQILSDLDMPLDKVVFLDVPDEVVTQRLTGRMGCTKCGEIYHAKNKPPKREGLCDKCNGPLFVRKDDQPETIRERLNVYHLQTAPLADYYESLDCLQRVDGYQNPESILEDIVGVVLS